MCKKLSKDKVKEILNKEELVLETNKFGRFCVATVSYNKSKGYGISRCSESDTYNEDEGINKACGRAKKALGYKLRGMKIPMVERTYLG